MEYIFEYLVILWMISCPKLILYKISQLLHPFHSLEESIRIFNILSSVAGESEYRYQKNCNRKCKSKTQFWTDCRSNKYFTNDEMTKKKKKGLIKAYFCLINLGSELLYGICIQIENAYYMVVMSRHLQRIISKRLFLFFLALQYLWLRTVSRERLEVQSQDMWAL